MALTFTLLIAACDPIVDARGYGEETVDTSQLVVGQSGKDDVVALLGTPTARSIYGEETWYYIRARRETVGMFAPEITDQNAVAVRFDGEGRVAAIDTHGKQDAVPVAMVRKETPTQGRELGFIEQLFGSVGRFGTPGRGISERNMGR